MWARRSHHVIVRVRPSPVPTEAPAPEETTADASRVGPLQALVDGFNEHICGPRSCVVSITATISPGGIGGLHLIERHTVLDHALDDVGDHRQHVAVFHHLGVIGDVPVTGDYHRAAWFEDLWNIRNDKLREQTIERLELALNADASCPIDDGELPQFD